MQAFTIHALKLILCCTLLIRVVAASYAQTNATQEGSADIDDAYDVGLCYTMHDNGYLNTPQFSAVGLLCTNSRGTEIYLINNGEREVLLQAPGCGRYTTLSPDKSIVGFKSINTYGMQAPALLDLATQEVTLLDSYAYQCGQISFADNGAMAYTVEDELVIALGDEKRVYPLNCYANIVTITKDATAVFYGDADGFPMMLNVQTGEKTLLADIPDLFIHTISPHGSHIVFTQGTGELYTYDIPSQTIFHIGKGWGASWVDDNTIVYTRSDYKDDDYFKFTGTSVWTTSYDGSTHQLIIPTTMECPQEVGVVNTDEIAVPFANGNRRIAIVRLSDGQITDDDFYTLQDDAFEYIPNDFLPVEAGMLSDPNRMTQGISGTIGAYDIPYIQQSWDVPESYAGCYSYGGAACAPCTSMMLMAYYDLADKWTPAPTSRAGGLCTWGTNSAGEYSSTYKTNGAQYHVNGVWGRCNPYASYVGLEYKSKKTGYTFSLIATKNSCSCKGACGYMWNNGSPASRMKGFYNKMGVTDTEYKDPYLSVIRSECAKNYPFSWCITSSRSNGHLILPFLCDATCNKGSDTYGNGQVCTMTAKAGSLVVNDPAGNANNATWRSDGRHATYDYSGYNNGYLTMNSAWGCYVHYKKSTVNIPVTGISLEPTSLELKEERSFTLTYSISPADATNTQVTWESSDTTMATVTDGKVTAVKEGTATISVTTKDGGFVATCTVTVLKPQPGDCNKYDWKNKGDMFMALQADFNEAKGQNISAIQYMEGQVYYRVNSSWMLWSDAETAGITPNTDDDSFSGVTWTCREEFKSFIESSTKWAWLKEYITSVSELSELSPVQWRCNVMGFFLNSPAGTYNANYKTAGKYTAFQSTWDETFCKTQTDVESTTPSHRQTSKFLQNGQLFIVHEGVVYTATGQQIQ